MTRTNTDDCYTRPDPRSDRSTAPTDAVAAYLAEHTIDCIPYAARISRAQCEINRRTAATSDCGAMYHCLSCRGGSTATTTQDQPQSRSPWRDNPLFLRKGLRPEPATNPKETTMAKYHGTCQTCKREGINLVSRNKCQRCYYREAHGLDVLTGQPLGAGAEEAPAAKPARRTPPAPPVPEPAPAASGINGLLAADGWLVTVPDALAKRATAAAVTPTDVVMLLELLLAGRLRLVA